MALALARCSLSLPHRCTGTRLSSRPAAPRAVRCCSAEGGRGSKRPGWLDSLCGGSGGGGSSSGDVQLPGQQEQFAYVQLLLGVVGTVLVVTGQVRRDGEDVSGLGGWPGCGLVQTWCTMYASYSSRNATVNNWYLVGSFFRPRATHSAETGRPSCRPSILQQATP
jgi:hypothetical protein